MAFAAGPNPVFHSANGLIPSNRPPLPGVNVLVDSYNPCPVVGDLGRRHHAAQRLINPTTGRAQLLLPDLMWDSMPVNMGNIQMQSTVLAAKVGEACIKVADKAPGGPFYISMCIEPNYIQSPNPNYFTADPNQPAKLVAAGITFAQGGPLSFNGAANTAAKQVEVMKVAVERINCDLYKLAAGDPDFSGIVKACFSCVQPSHLVSGIRQIDAAGVVTDTVHMHSMGIACPLDFDAGITPDSLGLAVCDQLDLLGLRGKTMRGRSNWRLYKDDCFQIGYAGMGTFVHKLRYLIFGHCATVDGLADYRRWLRDVAQVRVTFNLLTHSQLGGVHHARRFLPADDATMVTPTGLGFQQSVFNCPAAPLPVANETRVVFLARLADWYDDLFSGYDDNNYEMWLSQTPPPGAAGAAMVWGTAGRAAAR
jgi:hypothetical protein